MYCSLESKINAKEFINKLEIKTKKRKPVGISEDYASRIEEHVFTAYFNQIEVGHIVIDRLLKPTKEELKDDFFSDIDFEPIKAKPWLFFMHTEYEYKGNGIAGTLILYANEFYKSKYGTPLHSGTSNSADAIRVWEKLVNKECAKEYQYKSKRRWKLL
jgi:hypothetical protein